jgi:cell division protein FtsX
MRLAAVSLAVLLAGCAGSGSAEDAAQKSIHREADIHVYLPFRTGPAAVASARGSLRSIDHVIGVVYVSPEDALKTLSKADQERAKSLPMNPLPPSFNVFVDDSSAVAEVARVAALIPLVAHCGSEPCVTYRS